MRRFHALVLAMVLLMGGAFTAFELCRFILGCILSGLFFILPIIYLVHQERTGPPDRK